VCNLGYVTPVTSPQFLICEEVAASKGFQTRRSVCPCGLAFYLVLLGMWHWWTVELSVTGSSKPCCREMLNTERCKAQYLVETDELPSTWGGPNLHPHQQVHERSVSPHSCCISRGSLEKENQ